MSETLLLENHWLVCMASAGGGGRVTRTPGALVVTNPTVPGTFLNFITLRAVSPAGLEPALEIGSALLAGAGGRPPALFLSPLAGDIAALAEPLGALGWRRKARQVVLVRELPVPQVAVSPEVAVEAVEEGALDLWCRTLVEAYEVHPVAGRAICNAWLPMLKAPGEGARSRFLLARVNGKPAGTGLSWTQGEMTGLYCGAVLPAFRRRGVETATLVHRLQRAADEGSRIALLQTEAGSPVEHLCLGRLGFRRAYERELWTTC